MLLTGRALTTRAYLWPLQENAPSPPPPPPSAFIHSFIHSFIARHSSALWSRSKVVVPSWTGAVYFLEMCVLVSFTGQSAHCLPPQASTKWFSPVWQPQRAWIKNANPGPPSFSRKDAQFKILIFTLDLTCSVGGSHHNELVNEQHQNVDLFLSLSYKVVEEKGAKDSSLAIIGGSVSLASVALVRFSNDWRDWNVSCPLQDTTWLIPLFYLFYPPTS